MGILMTLIPHHWCLGFTTDFPCAPALTSYPKDFQRVARAGLNTNGASNALHLNSWPLSHSPWLSHFQLLSHNKVGGQIQC